MPPNWPPASFSGALEENAAGAPQQPPDDSGVNAHDPLVRLDAVTASPAWAAPSRESNSSRNSKPSSEAIPSRDVPLSRTAAEALVTIGTSSVALSPDAYRAELEQIGRESENLRLLVLQSERGIETQSQRQEIAQSEVAKVEQRLRQHSHEEIRAAYAHASETEMRAFMASEQRDQMLAKLQAFERYDRFLRGAVETLDSATTHAPSFPEVTRAPRIWSRAEPESTPGQYANAADEDDEYETLWMTPTTPIPTIHIASPLPDEVDDADDAATVSVDASTFRGEIGFGPPANDVGFDAVTSSLPEMMRSESSIPLPQPQLPGDQSPWVSRVDADDQTAGADPPASNPSQHVTVMGPRTASLDFRGENRGQWAGAHDVLNRVVQAQEEVAERVAQQIQEVSLQALSQLVLEADYFEHQAARDPQAALAGLQQVRAQLNAAL